MSDNAVPNPAQVVVHQRVAADLRTLADLAEKFPRAGELIAAAVSMLCLVVGRSSSISQEEFAAAAIELGGTSVPPASVEPYFATVGVELPAGAIRLMVTKLSPPDTTSLVVEPAAAVAVSS